MRHFLQKQNNYDLTCINQLLNKIDLRNKMTFSILIFISLFSIQSYSSSQAEIEKIIKTSGIPKEDLGIYIATNTLLNGKSSNGNDADNNNIGSEADPTIIYKLNESVKKIPASITKIITAAAVLEAFPPGTKLKTQLWTNGEITGEGKNKTLKGNLILKGGGDPSFVSESMWYLVNVFTREEIQKIEGDIWVDDSLFDALRFDPSRQKERVDRAYDAPTSAMSFNWNSVNVFIRPGEKVGAPAKVFVDPINDYIRLLGKVETTSAKTEVAIDRDESSKFEGDDIKVSGSISKNSSEVTVFKNVTKPDIWAGSNLKAFLAQRGIQVTGKVINAKLPASAKLVAESESKPIEHILADMNKFSNNYVAEMLTKNLAAQTDPPGSIEKGMSQIYKYLNRLGISSSEFVLTNPSGLNRENQITAKAMWKVVNYEKTQLKYFPEFSSSLPIAGIDGTLKKRMKGSVAERWVRAKTGYLTNVVSLAGYAGRPDGRIVSFVMMFNGKKDEAHVRETFDKICLKLVE